MTILKRLEEKYGKEKIEKFLDKLNNCDKNFQLFKQHILLAESVNEENYSFFKSYAIPLLNKHFDSDRYFLYDIVNTVSLFDFTFHYQDKWPDMNKLSIRWKNMFPDDPKADRGDKSLQEFCKNDNEEWAKLFAAGNTVIKTFVRTTGQIIYDERSNQTHNPIAGNKASYLCNGERLVGNWYRGPATDDDVKLYHYQYKSAKEWDWKCKNRLAVYGNRPFIYTYGQESIIERMK